LQGIGLGRCGHPLPPRRRLWCSDACCWKAWDEAHPRHEERDRVIGQRALPGQSRVERAFAGWIRTEDGQVVEAAVIGRARTLLASGTRHYGIAGIWEAIRYDFTLALKGEAGSWRLNNSFRSLLARKVMSENADLAGYFETRSLRGLA
jgi:hypothetical protein